MSIRSVRRLSRARPTIEGAGVRLHRAFGFGDTSETDPFLLFDDFRSDAPDDYRAGFPWHPHRGIETITYVLAGTVEHADSLGNAGAITAGDIQWMTAGRGIIHQEMPRGDDDGRMHGFQLWANLPAALKMTAPRYQEVRSTDIPEVAGDDGTRVRVVCGSFGGTTGPVAGVAADPVYLDVSVAPGAKATFPVEADHNVLAYLFDGSGAFSDVAQEADNRTFVVFGPGDEVAVRAGEEGMRFLLVAGRPLREPIAWHGPIVMNHQAEIRRAMTELEDGTFLGPREEG